nr:hypothetical protein [Thiolapillus sp.]
MSSYPQPGFWFVIGFPKGSRIRVVHLPERTVGIGRIEVAIVTEQVLDDGKLETDLKLDFGIVQIRFLVRKSFLERLFIDPSRVVSRQQDIVGTIRRQNKGFVFRDFFLDHPPGNG